MGIKSSMTGSPWHTERVHRGEDDERRYKGRCEYYEYAGGKCRRLGYRCFGSAHCDIYSAISDEEFKKRQKRNQEAKQGKAGTRSGSKAPQKPKGDDDVFWYGPMKK